MAQVRLRIELLEAETFFVVDVDLKAAHIASLKTLAEYIDKQIASLDHTYRVDETTLMVERVEGIFANENVIKNLDRAWLGRERAIVYGGADHVTDNGDQTGTQGEALKSTEETASPGSRLADAAKGGGNVRPSDKDSKKDTRRSPASHDERRTAEGERTVKANGEGDKQGPTLAPARAENVIRETLEALGIGSRHSHSADTFAASAINADEPMTPTGRSQTAGINIPIALFEALEAKDISDIGEGVGIVVLVEVVEIAVEADIVETMGVLAVLGMRKSRAVDITGMTKVLETLAMMGVVECPSHWREIATKIPLATEVVVPAAREVVDSLWTP